MAPNPKIKRACNTMKRIGIQEAKVRSVLKKLLKTYDNNWDFIEDEDYKVLLDAILDDDETDSVVTKKKNKEEKKESKDVSTSSGKKKAPKLKQTQPAVKDEEDDEMEEDETTLKKKAPKLKQTQPVVRDEEDDEMEEDEAPLKQRLRRKRQRECNNNVVPSLASPMSPRAKQEELKHVQPEEEYEDDDVHVIELPPIKRYLHRSGERRSKVPVYHASPSFSNPMLMEPEEVPPVLVLPSCSVQTEMDSDADAFITLNDEPLTDQMAMISDTGNCSAPMLEMEESKILVEEQDVETEVTLNDTTAVDAHPSTTEKSIKQKVSTAASLELASLHSGEVKISHSLMPANRDLAKKLANQSLETGTGTETETACGMSKTGDENGAADISMCLVVVPECEISADVWKAVSSLKDITVGNESIEIPWVNDINDEVPQRFHYMPHSCVFQDAEVKFSLSSFSDEQCCSSTCTKDCLVSAMPCNCAIAVDNRFSYTVDGVLKEDFLEERISEARDRRKQVLQFCEECPLEKAKNEANLDPCKGHLKRKAIKECWIKCGCSKTCGNRMVQRGIHHKLQVFFTPNGKGWGLRTLESLPRGTFVCEYIGEILTIQELYQRNSEEKLISPVILDAYWGSEEGLEDNKALCLDGTHYGNISRFLNHRCLDANLIEIPVQFDSPDQHYYHLAFFTTRDIEAMEELTWDYGIDFDDDDDDDYLMKSFKCLCGSRFCWNKKRSKKAKMFMNRT